MSVQKDVLLAALPPFNNQSVLIESAQDVPDIIREVLNAHNHFADDYNFIYKFFDQGSVKQICEQLFYFCKENISYVVESDREQTTKSPAAILALGYGDCKHYAAFISGVLNAISRNTGRKIIWSYRFASYNWFNRQPSHVFVVVFDRANEIWVDPCTKYFDDKTQYPVYTIDKKINAMPLYRVSGLPGEMGFIDPGVALNVIKSAADFFQAFGGGDKVPNYPIKSQNTLKAIQNDLASQIPMPPQSVEQAKQYLQYAKQKQQEFSTKPGSVDETKTIMYGEYATALQNFINTQTGSGGGFIPGGGSVPGATTKSLLIPAVAGGAVWFLTKKPVYALAAAAAAYFLLNRSISGVGQLEYEDSVNGCLY